MSDSWEIAAWRFEMISALLDENLSGAHKRRILRQRTKRAVQWPGSEDGGTEKPIARSTLFRWLKNYRDEGFVGLMPKVRKANFFLDTQAPYSYTPLIRKRVLIRYYPQRVFDQIETRSNGIS